MSNVQDCRVLVVEDEPLVALDIATHLRDAGCAVVGPFASAQSAIEAIAQGPLDAAILGIDLRGERSFPVAEALVAAGVPFLWLTGYSRSVVPEHFRDRPLVSKPVVGAELIRELAMLVRRS